MPVLRPLLRACTAAVLLSAAACSPAIERADAVVVGTPAPAAESIPADALRADFDALYSGLQAAHYDLYVRRPKDEYDARFRATREGFDTPMTPVQARIAYQRFVAYGNVAHARIDPPMEAWERFRSAGGRAFPLSVRVDGDRAYVIGGTGDLDGLDPGDRLETVDGAPALEWLGRMRTHISADNDYMAWSQLEGRLPLLAWLELGQVESFHIGIAKPDGRRLSLDVPARDRDEARAAAAAAPPHFELNWNTREARLLDGGIAYLRPGPFYDNRPEASHPWDPTDFIRFIDEAFAQFRDAGASRLLIDLRDNPGGDNSFSDPMIAWFADRPFRFSEAFEIRVSEATVTSNRARLDAQGGDPDSTSAQLAAAYAGQPPGSIVRFPIPAVEPRPTRRFDGRVYVLVNRRSYSNTVMVAAIVQDYGFGTVLGEETADLASTYGAMERFTLPRTGIEVGYPKARILRPNGDPRPRGVIPDIMIDSPIAGSATDVVLDRAIELIGEDAAATGR
ncbi:S41 family peptidase [Marilutibacter chinensis]|uniref:S41 family peptidase n=1 Tax=Marilutibacter chinensis TaxID=2912247 RepID=A0ABS9HVX9_9GAMM|nr:S41 family peptidase [Lysobacter chinensis]MCF7222232.1 S41 family peptidase [Lysobacter chinensis]